MFSNMDIKNKTIKQLKDICRKNNYKGFSKFKKKIELIQFILSKNNIELKKPYTLFDLVKSIKTNDLDTLLNNKKYNASKKGYLFENLWNIIIKCGCCSNFTNSLFQHISGNINLK